MRSGWPHTEDGHGRLPVDPRQAQFGPETSWPTGYPAVEYRDGDHRYPASRQALPPAGQGEHPYAAFSAAGYGDDGYSDPGYEGPASQDAGIAGTRTVRGFVESGPARPGYALPAAPQSGYAQPGYPRGRAARIRLRPASATPRAASELAYPMPLSAETYPAADPYRQPWDYDQPLRYDGEEASYPVQDSYGSPDSYQRPPTTAARTATGRPTVRQPRLRLRRLPPPGYDPAAVQRLRLLHARHQRPRLRPVRHHRHQRLRGVRLRRAELRPARLRRPALRRHSRLRRLAVRRAPGRRARRARFDETRFDVPRFDETRLDNLWRGEDDVRRDAPVGYGNDGFGGDSRGRSGYADFDRAGGARFDETRLDLALDRSTRFDVPVYDETRIDNLRAIAPAAATGLLAPPEDRPAELGRGHVARPRSPTWT